MVLEYAAVADPALGEDLLVEYRPTLQPDVESMARASLSFKVHTLTGMALFIRWPFTRLVHAMTAPVHDLFRPHVVYRTRDNLGFRPSPTRADWSPAASKRSVTSGQPRSRERSRNRDRS